MSGGPNRTYRAIDSDGHVLEPPDLWLRYIDAAYRDRAPRLIAEPGGRERIVAENAELVGEHGFGGIGDFGQRGIQGPYVSGRRGGFDPHARVVDMDAESVDAAFLYPSLGLFIGGSMEDPGLAAATCRTYNRWLADYCTPYPDRLFGVAMLPLQSVETAVEELRFAREELGMRAAFVRANPCKGRVLHDPANDPIWAAAQELDVAVALHVGGSVPTLGADRFKGNPGASHVVSHTLEMMAGAAGVILCGLCERFPRVRFAFLESGGGWIAAWLDRMDRHFDQGSWADKDLPMRPSEYFRRQCWISFEPSEGSLAYLAEYIGLDKILWATDYPHRDGFPGAVERIRNMPGLSAAAKRRILAEGAIRFYNMGRVEALMEQA